MKPHHFVDHGTSQVQVLSVGSLKLEPTLTSLLLKVFSRIWHHCFRFLLAAGVLRGGEAPSDTSAAERLVDLVIFVFLSFGSVSVTGWGAFSGRRRFDRSVGGIDVGSALAGTDKGEGANLMGLVTSQAFGEAFFFDADEVAFLFAAAEEGFGFIAGDEMICDEVAKGSFRCILETISA